MYKQITIVQILTRWYEDYVNPKYCVSQPSVESIEPSHFEGSIKYTSKTITETLLTLIGSTMLGTVKVSLRASLTIRRSDKLQSHQCHKSHNSKCIPQVCPMKRTNIHHIYQSCHLQEKINKQKNNIPDRFFFTIQPGFLG